MLEPSKDFIHRMRNELHSLSQSLDPADYKDLVAYFAGFFSEEDREVNGPFGDDEGEALEGE